MACLSMVADRVTESDVDTYGQEGLKHALQLWHDLVVLNKA